MAADYQDFQSSVAAEIKAYIAVQASLLKIATGDPTADAPKTVANSVESYLKAIATDDYKSIFSAAKIKYDLYRKTCPVRLKASVQQTLAPSLGHTFALKGNSNPFYTDQVTLKTDSNGFLTVGAPSTQSQVVPILQAVASDVGMFAAPGAGAAREVTLGIACGDPASVDIDQNVAWLACTSAGAADAKAAARKVLDLLEKDQGPGALPPLPGANQLPITYVGSLADIRSATGEWRQPSAFAPVNAYLSMTCSPRKDAPLGPAAAASPENTSQPGRYAYDGIVVSASVACRLRVAQRRGPANTDAETILSDNRYWAQDSDDLVLLPTRRGLLVARTVEYDFANGQATGVTDSRPSEALALVSLPGNIAGALVSGVTTRLGYSQSIANAQSAALTAQTNYLAAQAQLKAAQAAQAQAQAQAQQP